MYIQRIQRYRISTGLPTVIGVEDYEDPDDRDNVRKLVEEGMVEAWQKSWDLSQKGRHRYAFFPNASSRLRARWFVATHCIPQMVTGHGAFKERLHRLGLVEDPRRCCPLRGPETPEHILYECTKYNGIRDRLRDRYRRSGVTPQLDFWIRRGCYKDFAVYVGKTMRLRLEEEPLHRQL